MSPYRSTSKNSIKRRATHATQRAQEELCSGSDDFSKEVRTEFREECTDSYDEYDPEDDDSEEESDDARSISEEEQEDFCEYLMNTPS